MKWVYLSGARKQKLRANKLKAVTSVVKPISEYFESELSKQANIVTTTSQSKPVDPLLQAEPQPEKPVKQSSLCHVSPDTQT
ncbi:hypothetical protein SK128_004408, partial [Halocaridina rubra]